MLQYLIILLDDASTSFCHYENPVNESHLIPLDTLREGIRIAMKENLMVQFVYSEQELPSEYAAVIDSIDHIDIVPATCRDNKLMENAEVVVLNGWANVPTCDYHPGTSYVLRTDKVQLFEKYSLLSDILQKVERLNLVLTDADTFTESDFATYKQTLGEMAKWVEEAYVAGRSLQLNVLTDRMMLDKMNNCNAGWESITLAPDGRFYVCPAFYYAPEGDGLGNVKSHIGDLETGLDIKNPQLYRLDHAPICRHCDAYQCRRCAWLNRKTTYEVNTPSHEQCVVSHLERNASRELLTAIRKHGAFLPDKSEIIEIDYLDPFDNNEKW